MSLDVMSGAVDAAIVTATERDDDIEAAPRGYQPDRSSGRPR